MCGIFLSGCKDDVSDAKKTLRFTMWGSAEELSVVKHLVQDYERLHPDTHIELMHFPENYFQKLHILIAGGLIPDIAFVNSLNYSVYADNDVFMPLDAFLESEKSPLKRTDLFEPALEAFTWNQHIYAIPRDVSNLVVYYNKALFHEADVPLPSPNWSLTDMLNAAQQITHAYDSSSRKVFGISFAAQPPLMWLPYVWSQGGDLFDKKFTRFRLVEPSGIKALQFYADLRNRWHVAPTRKEVGSASMSQLFMQGKLAMMVSGRWSVPVFRSQAKFDWDIAPFPRGSAGSIVGIDSSGYAISKTTRFPQDAWSFIAFLSSPQAQTALAESGLIVPAHLKVARSQAFLQSPPQHSETFIDIIEHGYPTHVPARWNEIAEELGLALEPVFEGTKTAEEALKAVQPKIQTLLEES